MAGELFSGMGRDFVEMIDERFNKPPRQWSLGTWVFSIIVLGAVGFFLSLVANYILIPLWQFALWLSTGHPLAVLRRIETGVIFETFLFFGMMLFLIFGGISAVRNLMWAVFSMWKDKRSFRQQIADDLANEPRWRRLTFWPLMLFVAVFVGAMYVIMAYWFIHQMAHDSKVISQLRASISKCLEDGTPSAPARLELQEKK